MIDTNSRISQNSLQNTGTVQNRIVGMSEKITLQSDIATTSAQISSFSHQLSEAQIRADARDNSLDREALSAKANGVIDQFFGSSYQQNKIKYDAEIPSTNDPAHLDRAKQATAFANGQSENPFKGMARDQLTLIAYDESGTFTTNERRAALLEQRAQTFAWKAEASAEIMRQWDEKNGDISDALKSIMDYFEKFPPIEEAQYDSSWRVNLQNNIDHFSKSNSELKSNEVHLERLIEIVKESQGLNKSSV